MLQAVRAMSQAVNVLSFPAKNRVQFQASPCGICRGKVSLEQVLLRVFFPVNIILTNSYPSRSFLGVLEHL